MKKLCGLFLTALILLYSCQKETSFENGTGLSAEGTLQSDVTGDCLPKDVLGTYEATTELVATDNKIEIQVDVLKTGPYVITTDTVNGYFFRATGNFSATGLTTVTLLGKGTPLEDGIDNFRLVFDSTECIVPVTVLPEGGAVPAEMTFIGAPGNCLDYTVNGDYVINSPLDATIHSVDIKVYVTVAGTYSISTTASNGMTFTASGSLLAGEHIIKLKGAGTPITDGPTTIPVTYNTSSCSFTINVLAAPAPEKEYFPRTVGSNWSYETPGNADDSILYRSKTGGPVNIGGTPYYIFEGVQGANTGDLAGYRKTGSDYFMYTDLEWWLELDGVPEGELNFLKHNATVGTSWYSPVFTGTRSGVTTRLRVKFTILEKDVPVSFTTSLGNKTYPNTIVVEERNEIDQSGVWTSDIFFYKHYYAQDVGLVKDELYESATPATPAGMSQLRRHQIAP
jgi:hypothetical protein